MTIVWGIRGKVIKTSLFGGPEVFFKNCVAMKFVDDDDDGGDGDGGDDDDDDDDDEVYRAVLCRLLQLCTVIRHTHMGAVVAAVVYLHSTTHK